LAAPARQILFLPPAKERLYQRKSAPFWCSAAKHGTKYKCSLLRVMAKVQYCVILMIICCHRNVNKPPHVNNSCTIISFSFRFLYRSVVDIELQNHLTLSGWQWNRNRFLENRGVGRNS
jgi:hypothetical protein